MWRNAIPTKPKRRCYTRLLTSSLQIRPLPNPTPRAWRHSARAELRRKPPQGPSERHRRTEKRTRAPDPTHREQTPAPPFSPQPTQHTRALDKAHPYEPLDAYLTSRQHVVQKRFSRDLGGHDVLPYPQGGQDQRQEAGVRAQVPHGVHPHLRHHHNGWRAHVHAQGEAEALRHHDHRRQRTSE